MSLVQKFLSVLFVFLFINQVTAQWHQTNVLGVGAINCIATSNSKIFAGTFGGGVFLSSDSGKSWQGVNNSIITADAVPNVYSNQNVSDIVIVGNKIISGGNYGLLLSDNDGKNWTKIDTGIPNSGIGITVRSIAVNDSFIFAATSLGLFKTKDFGNNWTKIITLQDSDIYSIEIKYNAIYAGTTNGVYFSDTNGNSWTPLNTGIANKTIYSIAFSDSAIYAAAYDGVLVSTNQGASWTMVNAGISSSAWVHSIVIKGNTIFVGSDVGIYKNSLNGTTWTLVKNTVGVRAVSLFGNSILAGSIRTGMFLSADDGANWQEINNGLANSYVVSMASINDNLFASVNNGIASQDNCNGIYFSNTNGNIWTGKFANKPYLTAGKIISLDGIIYIATNNGSYLSKDNGDNWTQIFLFHNALIKKGSQIFSGGHGMNVSSDNGISWNEINNGLMLPPTFQHPQPYPQTITSLASIGNTIFAGTADGDVFATTDDGLNWNSSNLGAVSITAVLSLITSGQTIFAGVDGGESIYKSENNSNYWQSSSVGIKSTNPNSNVISVTCLGAYANTLFAGTANKGIFASTDNGNTWKNCSEGLSISRVTSMTFTNDKICIGTFGGGVWTRSLSEFTSNGKSENTWIDFPNPSPHQFTLALPENSTKIQIFNALGQVIQDTNLSNQKSVQLDLQSNGVYILKLFTSENTFVRKHIVYQ